MWTTGILASLFFLIIRAQDAPRPLFRLVDIKEHIGFLVSEHNRFRGDVSPPAADMRLLSWDAELAEVAERHASVCEFKHNATFSTSIFPHLGENIFAGNRGVNQTLKEAVQAWHDDEVSHYDFETNSCSLGSTECGHYTQLVWAQTYKVGCALTLCSFITELGIRGLMFSCYYGPAGNEYEEIGDKRVPKSPYRLGPPCTKCGEDEECFQGKLCAPIDDGAVRGPPDEETPEAPTSTSVVTPDKTTTKTTEASTTTKETATTSQPTPTVSVPTSESCPRANEYAADYKRWQNAMDKWDQAMEKLDSGKC